MTTSHQEFWLCVADDHSVLRYLLPDVLYSSDPFYLQSEAHPSPLSGTNLTNSPREGKSLSAPSKGLLSSPRQVSGKRAIAFSYSLNCLEIVFSETQKAMGHKKEPKLYAPTLSIDKL